MADKKKFTTAVVTHKSLLVGKDSKKKSSRKIRFQYVSNLRPLREDNFRPMRYFPYLEEQIEQIGVRKRVVIRFVSKKGKKSLKIKGRKVLMNFLNKQGIYLNEEEKNYPFFFEKRYNEDTEALEEEALGEVSGTVASLERQSPSTSAGVGNAKAGKRPVSKTSNGKWSKCGQDKDFSTLDDDEDAFVNDGPTPKKRRIKRISSSESSPVSCRIQAEASVVSSPQPSRRVGIYTRRSTSKKIYNTNSLRGQSSVDEISHNHFQLSDHEVECIPSGQPQNIFSADGGPNLSLPLLCPMVGSPSSIATIFLSDSDTTSLNTFESEEDMDSRDGSVQVVEEAIIRNVSTSSISSSSTLSTKSSSNLVLLSETTITPNGGYIIAAVGEIYNDFVASCPSFSPADLLLEDVDATATVSPHCSLSTMPRNLMETFLKWLDDDDDSAVLEELAYVRRRAASFRQRHFDQSSSCRTVESAGSQSRLIQCLGNHVFHCPNTQRAHKDSRCHEGSICWKDTYHLMGDNFDKREQGKSLQAMVEKLPWKTNAVVGLLEIKLSETLIPRKLYQTHSGPLCRVCERRVSTIHSAERQSCHGCKNLITTEYYGPPHYHPIVVTPRVTTSPETLYYLCFRKSDQKQTITKKTIKALRASVAASERNPGRFGQTNRPGYPQPWRVAGKFCSASCAMSPLSMMFFPTKNQLKNVYPLSCLSDAIVNDYYPGNTVVIAMSHPASFCVCHQDLAAFLDELCRRGIPLNCLFFYYHGVVDKITGIQKGETIVSGSALLSGIHECVPRYGVRPAVSGVLYAAEKACQQRLKGARKGRNLIDEENRLTASQQILLNHDRRRFKLCAEVRCDSHIGADFALRCVLCTRWFHGECVNVNHSMLVSLHKHRLVWICRQCNIGRLMEANQVVDAVQLAYTHQDSQIYTIIASQYAPNFDWTPVFTFMGNVPIFNDQMDINSLMVCAIYFNVDVLKRNPALTRLPHNAYRQLFIKYMFCHSHVDEAVMSYLQSVTMNVGDSSLFGAISSPSHVNCSKPARRSKLTRGGPKKKVVKGPAD